LSTGTSPSPLLAASGDGADLAACDREPIHIPGAIQPHGHLLALEGPELRLLHASAAATEVLRPATLSGALGRPLAEVADFALAERQSELLRRLPGSGPVQLGQCRAASGRAFDAIAHRSPDGLAILELEEAAGEDEAGADQAWLFPQLRDAFDRIGRLDGFEALLASAAAEARALTGFDRVLIYRFEENWDGTVVAEDRNGRLPSYLGLRFPASDIPAQARRLYQVNRHRIIPDAGYAPVPVLSGAHPGNGRPLDLSLAALRSVSPLHLEYMRGMGTPASMSISLLRADGGLWGLLSCHHAEPRRVPFVVRGACDLLGQMLAVRIAAKEAEAEAEERLGLKRIEGRLLARMAADPGRFAELLATGEGARDLCGLTGASGAAVIHEGACTLAGRTPDEAAVRRIAEWLAQSGIEDVHATRALPEEMPGAAAFADTASGLLAISASRLHRSFVLWFRPELVRTVEWGGDPRKRALPDGMGRLNPRRSFDAWKETVRLQAAPWRNVQVAAARELRSAIVEIVLRQAEERAAMVARLERINRELASFSYSVSHDLRAPFRHITGYAELLRELDGERLSEKGQRFLSTIVESAQAAGALVDGLLAFSHLGRATLGRREVDTATLAAEVIRNLSPDIGGRRIEWRVGPLPVIRGDAVMLRQVFHNLLANAVKYTLGRDPAVIELTCDTGADEFTFSVRDNGAGFEMAYAHKLFGVFQRLHRSEDFEGIGIGLANVRRIVERHGGRCWAEGEVGRGATFHFTLPRGGPPQDED
jgi:light-regulated signal transduction histidine kinase (bacteriophytochrome)